MICALAAVVLQPTASAQQQASPEKPMISTMLVANVWPGGYSEIYPLDSLSGSRVVSNIDFSILEPAVMIETPEAFYDFFILCSRWTVEDVVQGRLDGSVGATGFPKSWPLQLPPKAGPARFLAINPGPASLAPTSDERRLLELLHRHFQANRIRLEADAQQREIDQARATAEEAARRAAIPPHFGPPVFFKGFAPVSPAASPTP